MQTYIIPAIIALGSALLGSLWTLHIKKLEDKKQRKINIFKTLMTTRREKLSFEHVRALNMIDVEFYNDSLIRKAWEEYLKHLCESYGKETHEQWIHKGEDIFTDLLMKIGKSLKYEFDINHLKRGIYSPIAHNDLWNNQTVIVKSLAEVLNGSKTIKVEIEKTPCK